MTKGQEMEINIMKKITIQHEATIKAEGNYNSKHCKPIMCIKNDGSELRSFSSVWDAAKELGINPGYISTCMSKGVACKGYTCCSTKDAASFISAIVDSYNRNANDASQYRRIKAEEEAIRIAEERRLTEERKAKERKIAAIAKAEAKVTKYAAACSKYEVKWNESMKALDEANKELEALLDEGAA
jgi:hypothetical protein